MWRVYRNPKDELYLKLYITFGGGQKTLYLMIHLQHCYIDIDYSKPIRKDEDYNGLNTFEVFGSIIDKKTVSSIPATKAVSR